MQKSKNKQTNKNPNNNKIKTNTKQHGKIENGKKKRDKCSVARDEAM